MQANKTSERPTERGDRITFRRGSLTQAGEVIGFWRIDKTWGFRVRLDDGSEIDVPRGLQIDGSTGRLTEEECAAAKDALFDDLEQRAPGGWTPSKVEPRTLFWKAPVEGSWVKARVTHCVFTGRALLRLTWHLPYDRAARVQVPAVSREFEADDLSDALDLLRERMGALEICPGCGAPAHATESDDDGYHAGCRGRGR